MLKLKTLTISNVGRFVGLHEISFEARANLIQIDAVNKNTGGSSGSGKSTIFNSLEYLLGINGLPATVLQSRLTKSSMCVCGTFDYDGKELIIKRSKSEGLSIVLDGIEIVSGSNKAAEEKLDEILAIPRELIRKMIHKRQKEGGFFLGLTPKECHLFLAEALSLKTWTQRLATAEQDFKNFEQESQTSQAALETIRATLDASLNSLGLLSEPALDWDPSILPVLKNNLEKAENLLRDEALKLEQELLSVEKPEAPKEVSRNSLKSISDQILQLKAQESAIRKIAMDNWNSLSKELAALESEFLACKKAADSIHESSLKLEEIKSKIISIKNGICPTCKQSWHQGSNEIDILIAEARKKTLAIQNSQECSLKIPILTEQISEKKKQVNLAQAEISNNQIAPLIQAAELELKNENEKINKENQLLNQAHLRSLEIVREKEAAIRSKFNETISGLAFNRDEQQRLYFTKKSEYESFQKNIELFTKNKQLLNQTIESQKRQLAELEEKNKKANSKKLISAETAKLLKSYINNLFQGALDTIATKATQILSRIPNMSTASVYFEGFKETKNGSIKDEVSAILTMDGEIDIPVKSMSGGERTAIDLAVDLAVIDMIEEQAGKGLDIFILDEPFDGLDSVCREECLQILQTHVTGKKIIVVDHSNETKELVHDRILVIRDGQESIVSDLPKG